jgi:hypothetical protein
MKGKDEFPEVLSWKEDVRHYFESKRLRNEQFYRNPDYIPQRSRGNILKFHRGFDPILNRYFCDSKDQEYAQNSLGIHSKKKVSTFELSCSTKYNIFTLPDSVHKSPKNHSRHIMIPHFDIITNSIIGPEKPVKLFPGKKQVEHQIETLEYNIINNVPTSLYVEKVQNSKPLLQVENSKIFGSNDFNPILMMYKDNAKETEAQRLEAVSIQKKSKKANRGVNALSQKHSINLFEPLPSLFQKIGISDSANTESSPQLNFKMIKSESFEDKMQRRSEDRIRMAGHKRFSKVQIGNLNERKSENHPAPNGQLPFKVFDQKNSTSNVQLKSKLLR